MAISTPCFSNGMKQATITPSSNAIISTGSRSHVLSHQIQFPTKLNLPYRSLVTAAATANSNNSTSSTSSPPCPSAKALGFLSNVFTSFSNLISPTTTQDSDHKTTTTTQILHVYELNEGDRNSPAFLKLSKHPNKSLGDLVPFSNKLYSGDLKTRLGISAGMIIYIEDDPEGAGDRYEAIYSFYFGSCGHISAQGAYFSQKDSELVVTGGTGIFEGVTGKAKISNVIYPFKLYYVFELKGLKELLPMEVIGGEPVKPTPDVKASPDAKPLVLLKSTPTDN